MTTPTIVPVLLDELDPLLLLAALLALLPETAELEERALEEAAAEEEVPARGGVFEQARARKGRFSTDVMSEVQDVCLQLQLMMLLVQLWL